MKLSELKAGQSATILSVEDEPLSLKLFEMGCLPGERVTLESIAPFGDPLAIRVSGYKLCLRRKDAEQVVINDLSE